MKLLMSGYGHMGSCPSKSPAIPRTARRVRSLTRVSMSNKAGNSLYAWLEKIIIFLFAEALSGVICNSSSDQQQTPLAFF